MFYFVEPSLPSITSLKSKRACHIFIIIIKSDKTINSSWSHCPSRFLIFVLFWSYTRVKFPLTIPDCTADTFNQIFIIFYKSFYKSSFFNWSNESKWLVKCHIIFKSFTISKHRPLSGPKWSSFQLPRGSSVPSLI